MQDQAKIFRYIVYQSPEGQAPSLSYHSLVGHNLLDVSIEERDDDSLAVNTDVFSCAICEGDHAGAITVHFLYLKPERE